MTANKTDSLDTEGRSEGNDESEVDTRVSGAEAAPSESAVTDASETDEQLDHAARADLLAEENRRLRSEYARAQEAKYRQTAYGLAGVGILAVLGGLLFPAGREVLFALGGIGLFGAILTRYLTPGQFITADISERVYAAMAANEAAIADELGLKQTTVYVPLENTVQLYLPQQAEYDLPSGDSTIIVEDDSRGLCLETTGANLFDEFERALTGQFAETPTTAGTQLADGIVEQFELATSVETDIDQQNRRATFHIDESAFGDLDRIDHPVVSFLAVGFARMLDSPVTADIVAGEQNTDWLVTLRWKGENMESDQQTD